MAVVRLTLWKRTERLPNKQCYLSIENKNKTFYKQISASACLGLVLRHPVDLFSHAATLTFFGSLIKVCKKLALGLGSPFRPPDRSFRNFWSFGEFYEVQKRHATRILKLQSCEWVGRAISAGGDRVCCCCSLRSKLVYSVDRVCCRCFLRSKLVYINFLLPFCWHWLSRPWDKVEPNRNYFSNRALTLTAGGEKCYYEIEKNSGVKFRGPTNFLPGTASASDSFRLCVFGGKSIALF